jgi:hypothetical protein
MNEHRVGSRRTKKQGDPRSLWKGGASLGDIAQNSDGTWNVARALSALSGLEESEVAWTWRRMKELKDAGHGKEEMVRIVRDEAITRPWSQKR